MPERRAVSMVVYRETTEEPAYLIALCSDGTTWQDNGAEWVNLGRTIPGCSEPEAPEGEREKGHGDTPLVDVMVPSNVVRLRHRHLTLVSRRFVDRSDAEEHAAALEVALQDEPAPPEQTESGPWEITDADVRASASLRWDWDIALQLRDRLRSRVEAHYAQLREQNAELIEENQRLRARLSAPTARGRINDDGRDLLRSQVWGGGRDSRAFANTLADQLEKHIETEPVRRVSRGAWIKARAWYAGGTGSMDRDFPERLARALQAVGVEIEGEEADHG